MRNDSLIKLKQVLTIDIDRNRNYGLDILRALAIFFVMNIHSANILNTHSTLFKILTITNLDGVALFFILSGFLIGNILIRMFENEKLTVRIILNFWKRRWFKTLPSYFLILTLLLLWGVKSKSIQDYSQVKNYFFFLANLKSPLPDYLFPESWSLSIEEWFYILIPVFIFMLVKVLRLKPKHSISIVAISILIFSTWFRYYRLSCWPGVNENMIDANFRKQVITRLDSLMYGIIGAFLACYHLSIWKRYKKMLFATGIFLLYIGYWQYCFGYFGSLYAFVFSFSIQSIGFLCLFPWATQLKSGKGFIYKTITRFSIISYSVYLLNYSIVKQYLLGFLDKHLFKSIPSLYLIPFNYFAFWAISIVGPILLYKYFEKPMMNLRGTSRPAQISINNQPPFVTGNK